MDNYMTIFQGILSTEPTFLDIYLDGLDEHIKFYKQKNHEVDLVQHISSLLITSKTLILGLRLLDKFIDNCSIDVLEKKGNLWINMVLKACNNQELESEALLLFQVLNKIIKNLQRAPDLVNSFISTHVSKVYEILANVPSSQSKYALNCIETCLRVYPGSSSPSRAVIERFLWKNIDRIDNEAVQSLGKCLHLLQQLKGGGVQGVSHKTKWKNYQFQLIGGIHSVYNEMFANCKEIYAEKIEQGALPWEAEQIKYDPDPVKRAAQMYTRLRNMVTYLIIALIEPFPVEKPIVVKKILNIVARGMSVNCLMLEQNPISDNIALGILLPKLHEQLLNLLNVAVTILRGNLRSYSEDILGLMVDSLKWTSAKNLNGEQKVLLSLRKKVYDSISLWSKILCSGNRCETIAEYLFQEILSDILPAQSEFTLKVLSGALKHMSKKSRRQLHNAQNEKSNMANTHSANRDKNQHLSEKQKQELCISALRCFQEIVFSVGSLIKPNILKMMQTSITNISAVFYELDQKPGNLYINKNCRIEIYNALYASLMTTHHLCPPPTELVLAIIETAYTRDDSFEVRARCGFILKNLEKIIHPQKESLLYPIEARDIRNTFIKMGQENLLREFEINFSNSLSNNNVINIDNEVLESCKSINNANTDCGSKLQTNNTPNFDNHKEIQSKYTVVKDIVEIRSVNETNKNQVVNDNEILPGAIDTTNNNTESIPNSPELVLRVNDDEDIATVDEQKKDAINDSNINEPRRKKQKFNNEDNKKEFSIVLKNLYLDDDNLLAEIASQFIDELD